MFKYSESYQRFARVVSEHVGTPFAFIGAISMIAVWFVFGPLFHFSDTYQLVINTVTTILTFLMVFVIQNTQNHDTEVMQLKLDELIRVTQGKHILLSVEELSEESIERLKEYYSQLADEAREQIDVSIVDLSE
ncbi:MAG: low affinity iron permease family protein [Nitrosopumilaceae archaeon]